MEKAGVDISIFKAHSFMGASCLTAAGAGVMTKDILDAADWLVERRYLPAILLPKSSEK